MFTNIDWRVLAIAVLLLGVGLAASRAFAVGKEDQARAASFLSMRGLAFGLMLALSFAVFSLWGGAPAAGAGGASTDSLTLFSMMIGAIGVVITVLTGLSLTTAWRAIDDAGRALRETGTLMRQVDAKILGATKLGSEFQRLAALVEASNALNKVKGVADEREAELACQQVLDAFTQVDEARTLAVLGDMAGNASILLEMGPLARIWLAGVAANGQGQEQRKAFRLLDALEQAREAA